MRASPRRRTRRGSLPQECPHCCQSLADPGVPAEHARHADMFSLALSTPVEWICPLCLGRWPK